MLLSHAGGQYGGTIPRHRIELPVDDGLSIGVFSTSFFATEDKIHKVLNTFAAYFYVRSVIFVARKASLRRSGSKCQHVKSL